MSDALTAASAYTVEIGAAVNQPAFTLGAALRTSDQNGQDAESQDSGDTVIISEQGKNLAARQAASQDSSEQESDEEVHIRQIKERIAKLQQEIEELQADQTMDEDKKRQQLLAKQSELAELQTQLSEAYEEQNKAASSASSSANRTAKTFYGATS